MYDYELLTNDYEFLLSKAEKSCALVGKLKNEIVILQEKADILLLDVVLKPWVSIDEEVSKAIDALSNCLSQYYTAIDNTEKLHNEILIYTLENKPSHNQSN